MNDVCPISHIPVSQLQHPVVVRAATRAVVYDAEHIVRWLKHHSLMDPVTHARIRPGFAVDILRPAPSAGPDTRAFLARAGYVDGRGGQVIIFGCIVVMNIELVTTLLAQLPRAVEFWLRMNTAQRFWMLIGTIPAVALLVTGMCAVWIAQLQHHFMLQVQHPLDLANALHLAQCLAVVLVLTASTCAAAFVAYTCVRAQIQTIAAIVLAIGTLTALFIVVAHATMTEGVTFEDNVSREFNALIRPWLTLAYRYVFGPALASMRDIAQGPVCAFSPGSVWCNLSLRMLEL